MGFWADRLPAPPPLPLYEECFRCARIVPKVACGSAPAAEQARHAYASLADARSSFGDNGGGGDGAPQR